MIKKASNLSFWCVKVVYARKKAMIIMSFTSAKEMYNILAYFCILVIALPFLNDSFSFLLGLLNKLEGVVTSQRDHKSL